jgi:hypothetical protein
VVEVTRTSYVSLRKPARASTNSPCSFKSVISDDHQPLAHRRDRRHANLRCGGIRLEPVRGSDRAIYTVALVMVVTLVFPLIVRRPARPGPLRFESSGSAVDVRTRA